MLKAFLLINYILLLHVCYTDVTRRIIKNKTIVAIILVSIFCGIIQYGTPEILLSLTILFIGIIFSASNFFGAGDVKLIFALSLSLSKALILQFVLATMIAGLIVVFPVIICSFVKKRRLTVPYGIAISLGYFFITITMT